MSDFRWKEMRKWGELVGREGMSIAVLEAIEDFDGSYIEAMVLAGKLKAIAQAASCDDYWSEKVAKGYSHAYLKIKYDICMAREEK